ncbi:MAG: hypothetical protein VB875_10730 [Pirellulales bacterium]
MIRILIIRRPVGRYCVCFMVACLLGAAPGVSRAAEDTAANFDPAPNVAPVETAADEDLNETLIPTTVGMEASYRVRFAADLKVKAADERSSFRVRVESVRVDGDAKIFELRYMAVRGGTYDLRDYLEPVGSDAEPLPSMKVDVQTILGNTPIGDLWPVTRPKIRQPLRYRLLLVLMATLWSVPLVWIGLRRLV